MDDTVSAAQGIQQDTTAPQQGTLFELENLAVSHLGSIEKLQEEKKKLTQELQDSYENDSVYHEKSVIVSQQAKDLAATKEQIAKQPHLMQMQEKIKSLTHEIKDKKAALSDYALEVTRIAGVNQIERDGEVYDIITMAKLVKHPKAMQQ
ncbi:MAG: hypothetical protein KGI08_01920 [Thaumarchaeota archaeon]|nr:hypothetical protein [Nitrososphaerota archaeon]